MSRVNLIIVINLIVLFSCGSKNRIDNKLNIQLEKIVIANLNEVCITFFKIKIENTTNQPIILIDNDLNENSDIKTNKGFYLFEDINYSTKPLKIDNYLYYRIEPKTKKSYFIGAKNLKYSYDNKDSLLFKNEISKYKIIYNGKDLNLNNLIKSKYISQEDFNQFVRNKETYIPYKDSCVIPIPKDIKIRYINKLPIKLEEWQKL